MLNLHKTNSFLRDLKLLQKRRIKFSKLWDVVELLENELPLPLKHKNHLLINNWKDHWECHITFDWVLVYKIEGDNLYLIRTGTHNDVFK
jgi:mRNA interferase YafQ